MSLLITALSSLALFKEGQIIYFITNYYPESLVFIYIATTLSNQFLKELSFDGNTNCKIITWAIKCTLASPIIALFGETIAIKAAIYTGITITLLTFVAFFLNVSSHIVIMYPLSGMYGFITVLSVFSIILGTPSTTLGICLLCISLHGGFIIYAGLLIINTQRLFSLVKHRNYDVVYYSFVLYMVVLNIFMRIAMYLLINSDLVPEPIVPYGNLYENNKMLDKKH